MVISSRDPVSVLEQRVNFVEGIVELAALCNWKDVDIEELRHYIGDQLVRVDKVLYTTYKETKDKDLSHKLWEVHMEDLRHSLSLILGVKIRYV